VTLEQRTVATVQPNLLRAQTGLLVAPVAYPASRPNRACVLAARMLTIQWKRKSAELSAGCSNVATASLSTGLLLLALADTKQQPHVGCPRLTAALQIRVHASGLHPDQRHTRLSQPQRKLGESREGRLERLGVLINRRRPVPGTRAVATTVSRCTSSPAHRSTITSIGPAPSRRLIGRPEGTSRG
jgi:hypothetical protein